MADHNYSMGDRKAPFGWKRSRMDKTSNENVPPSDEPACILTEAPIANNQILVQQTPLENLDQNERFNRLDAARSELKKKIEDLETKQAELKRTVHQQGRTIALQRTMHELALSQGNLGGASFVQGTFEFEPMETREQLQELESKLATDAQFRSRMTDWLCSSTRANEAENRLHEAIDLLFDRELFTKCSWTGRGQNGPKIAISTHVNILEIMVQSARLAGDIPDDGVKRFMQRKLKNAKTRLELKGTRKTCCRIIRFKP